MVGLRERSKQRTRVALEDAALRLFARDGFDDTTIEAIAAEADVSARTFFRYFSTKDQVLFSERELRLADLHDEIVAQPARLRDLTVLGRALVAIAPGMEADRGHMLLRQQAVASTPLLRGRLFDVLASWERTMADGLRARGSAHAELAAGLGVAAFRTAMTRWLRASGSADPLARHLEEAFEEASTL